MVRSKSWSWKRRQTVITVTVNPEARQNIYSLMVQEEIKLRKKSMGTLHRLGSKKKNEDKWVHSSYQGWIRFQKCLGGVVVAQVQAKDGSAEWQLLTSLLGFLDRHFRENISNINLNYESAVD
jgi:hypothetical protein